MSLSTSTRRAASAALMGSLALLGLTACGQDTWKGSLSGDDPIDVRLGDWKGELLEVTVECTGDVETVTATLTTPGSVTATLVKPENGGPGTLRMSDGDREREWDTLGRATTIPAQQKEDGDDDLATTWGAGDNAVATTPDTQVDEDGADISDPWVFDMNGAVLDCSKGE